MSAAGTATISILLKDVHFESAVVISNMDPVFFLSTRFREWVHVVLFFCFKSLHVDCCPPACMSACCGGRRRFQGWPWWLELHTAETAAKNY